MTERKPTSPEDEILDLRRRLEEAEETLRALRTGEVDALVVEGPQGDHIYTLHGADHSYRVLIEAMQQGAVSLSSDSTVLYCNRCFSEMLKRPHEKVIGSSAMAFVPPAHRANFAFMLRRAVHGASQGELEFQVADGVLLPVYLAIAPLALPGSIALCMVVTDLTDQKRHQDLEEANRRKDEFLAMLAHELRNPLAPIRNAAGLLSLVHSNDEKLGYATNVIERQVQHLSRLVDDLLDVSRISLGKVKLQFENVDLATVVSGAIETSRPVIEDRKHKLVISQFPKSVTLRADPIRLAQVISNLLTNAAKYTAEGGEIHITTELREKQVVIHVRDTGIGITPELLPHVFDLFIQGDRSLARSEGGLGIGLTLVRRLVELHGGMVEAKSQGPGMGSEFIVSLPVANMNSHAHGDSGTRAETIAVSQRILIVEDNRDGADSLAMLLRSMGHDVKTAYTGTEALDVAAPYRPSVVLLDIGLPGLSGYEVAKRLRQWPGFERAVFVATSGYGQDEDKQRSREAGFHHHLVKPIDLTALQSVLATPGQAPN